MKRHLSKIILFSLPLILGVHLLIPPFQVMAQDTRQAQPDQTAEPKSPAEVDSYLAGMSDEQIRQAYKEKLKQDTAGRHESEQVSEEYRSWFNISTKFILYLIVN